VVGVRLKGKSQDRNGLAAHRPAASADDFSSHSALALIIDSCNFLDNAHRRAMVLRGLDERLGVLWKARAAISWPGMQEFGTDPFVEADAARDVLYIGPCPLAKIGNLIDEGYLGRQKSVGCIFRQLCGPAASKKEWRLIEVKRPVDFPHDRFGALV